MGLHKAGPVKFSRVIRNHASSELRPSLPIEGLDPEGPAGQRALGDPGCQRARLARGVGSRGRGEQGPGDGGSQGAWGCQGAMGRGGPVNQGPKSPGAILRAQGSLGGLVDRQGLGLRSRILESMLSVGLSVSNAASVHHTSEVSIHGSRLLGRARRVHDLESSYAYAYSAAAKWERLNCFWKLLGAALGL